MDWDCYGIATLLGDMEGEWCGRCLFSPHLGGRRVDWDCNVVAKRLLRERSSKTRKVSGVGLQRDCYGIATGLRRDCDGIATGLRLDCDWIATGLLRDCYGIAAGFLQDWPVVVARLRFDWVPLLAWSAAGLSRGCGAIAIGVPRDCYDM